MNSNQPSIKQTQNRGALRRRRKALRREQAIITFYALIKKGLSKRAAARELRIGYTTIWRWRQAYHARGIDGLLDGMKPGAPSIASRLKPHLTPEVLAVIRRLAVETGSAASALRQFARGPDCPPALAAFMRGRRHLPASVGRLVGLRKIRAIIFVAGDYSRTADLEHARAA